MEPGVEARIRDAVDALEGAGAIVEEVSLPHTDYGLATYYIVVPGGGVGEPRALRRRALRPLGPARRRRLHRRLPRDAWRGLRARGEAPDHARHVRALGRLLRRVLPQGPEGPDADQARLRRGLRVGHRRARRAHVAVGRVPVRRPHRGSGRDVPLGRVHAAREHGRDRRGLRARAACPTACRSGCSSSARPGRSSSSSASAARTRRSPPTADWRSLEPAQLALADDPSGPTPAERAAALAA